MKTQILRLEPHDDSVSVRDKMNWIQTRRILVVWPDQADILSQKIDLVLLNRQIIKQGAQLAIVSSNTHIRNHARELNIPIFVDLNKAQRSRWHIDRRYRSHRHREPSNFREKQLKIIRYHSPRSDTYPKEMMSPASRIVIFALGVLSILSVAALLFPKANITLSPKIRQQEISINVRASPEVNEINLSGAIPARQLSIIVEGRDSLPTTGKEKFPQGFATGSILVTNLTNKELLIPQGTIIRSDTEDSIRFVSTKSGKLPPQAGGSISLSVRALLPGVSGNLPRGSLTILEGSDSQNVTITNPLPTRGGKQIDLPSPSQEDIDKLDDQLQQSLRESVIHQARNQIKSQDLVVENSVFIDKVLLKEIDPPIGKPGEQITLLLRLEYIIVVVSGEDIKSLAEGVLNANTPDGFSIVPGSIQINHTEKPRIGTDNYARWQFSASANTQAVISEQNVIRLVLGAPVQKIKEVMSTQLQLQAPAQISTIPGWWPRMPFLPFRISIEYSK